MRYTFLPKFPKSAGSIKEFDDWDKRMKNEHPVLFKIDHVIHIIRTACVTRPSHKLRHAKLWVLHRVHPKYIHHVVKPSTVTPGYIDPCEMLLHCNFHIFSEFMKHQLRSSHVLWFYDEIDEEDPELAEYQRDRNAVWDTMTELYDWWTKDRPARTEVEYPAIPNEWGFLACLNEDYADKPEMVEWKRVARLNSELEGQWVTQDQEMLHKLIDIRQYLWD